MDGTSGMYLVTHLVPKHWGLKVLQSANHRDHPCTWQKLGLNMLQRANHRNRTCTFKS
ncbi:hypothetical protein Hanom_Chr05g00461601 [Helianthus anomalus]